MPATPQFNAGNEQWDLRVTVAWRYSGGASALGSALTRSTGSSLGRATEQHLMEELILERTEVPVHELSVTDVGT